MFSTPMSPPSRPWLRVITRSMLALMFFLAVAGFLYENIAETRDRRFNAMAGQLVDVGGYKMHIHCTGQGSPAVILDSGLGDSYISWRIVQPQIAKFARVCSYDRAGTAYSEPSPHTRTSRVVAEELHTLLHNAGVTGPIVLVGHSAGGYDVRVYTSMYRNEVVGMVLVDASHPDQEKRFPPALKNLEASWLREFEFLEYTAPFGIPRLMGFCDPDPVVRAAECNFNTARENVAEMKAIEESATQTAATGSLEDLPLAVLSHDPTKLLSDLPADLAKPINDDWEKMQEELSRLSSRGTQTIATNSAHYIQIDRPEVVVEAVRTVVNQARASQH